MSKIGHAFDHGKAFIGFLTAGDPSIEKSCEFILTMEKAGADLVEIGIPFSDPIAEGPVIQEANIRALSVNTRLEDVFRLVAMVRQQSQVPLVFLTYLNPVFNYGVDEFFAACERTGLDGIIIPDMPYEERNDAAAAAKAHGIDIISMIAPTSKDRIKKIAAVGSGFLYVVSSLGVTGVRSEITTNLDDIIDVIRAVTDVPAAVGFGINTPDQAAAIAKVADDRIAVPLGRAASSRASAARSDRSAGQSAQPSITRAWVGPWRTRCSRLTASFPSARGAGPPSRPPPDPPASPAAGSAAPVRRESALPDDFRELSTSPPRLRPRRQVRDSPQAHEATGQSRHRGRSLPEDDWSATMSRSRQARKPREEYVTRQGKDRAEPRRSPSRRPGRGGEPRSVRASRHPMVRLSPDRSGGAPSR